MISGNEIKKCSQLTSWEKWSDAPITAGISKLGLTITPHDGAAVTSRIWSKCGLRPRARGASKGVGQRSLNSFGILRPPRNGRANLSRPQSVGGDSETGRATMPGPSMMYSGKETAQSAAQTALPPAAPNGRLLAAPCVRTAGLIRRHHDPLELRLGRGCLSGPNAR